MQYVWGIQLRGLADNHLSLPLPYLIGRDVYSDTIDSQSVVAGKPGDSVAVIRYQVDNYTDTWSSEWFIA